MSRFDMHTIRTGGASAALVAVLGLAFACSESPTEVATDDLAPQFDKKGTGDCETKPHNVHCHGEDPAPPPPSEQVDFDITFSDADGDALSSDLQGQYQEGVDGVGAHLSGANGNLMFDVDQYAAGSRRVQINLGSAGAWAAAVTRIYTNNNETIDDLRDMDNGDATPARMFVEWKDGRISYDLRFGTNCLGDKFNADSQNDDSSTRVNISKGNGDTWIVIPSGDAYLCKLNKGNKPPDETLISGPVFQLTMVEQAN
jgi:hypothetical protein